MFASWKMAPALAARNCIVMKPSEITPLTSLRIAELMQQAGLPDGAVNMVPGLGSVVGQYIAEHPGIAKVAFTDSTATGRRVVQASAGNLKKVQLELGGKGPNIVFEDAFLPAAINGSAWAIFHNQGRPASPARGWCCTKRSPTSSSTSSSHSRGRSGSATRSMRPPRWGRSPVHSRRSVC
jgi:betaine-aldehyde dehydrogenase